MSSDREIEVEGGVDYEEEEEDEEELDEDLVPRRSSPIVPARFGWVSSAASSNRKGASATGRKIKSELFNAQ